MSKIVPIGLGVAAVVFALFAGAQLFGTPTSGVGGPPDSSATPAASASPEPSAEPSATPEAIEPYQVVVSEPGDPVQVSFTVTSPGWTDLPGLGGLTKNDDGLDPPDTEGIAVLAWSWPAGTGFHVYGHPCQWSSTVPETPATTWREILAAFENQAETEILGAAGPPPFAPGIDGVRLGIRVPLTYEVPGATREEEFSACDESIYGFYGIEGGTEPERNAQGPGQVDELWILDVGGNTVILDVMYGPATPAELVDEAKALVESATFEVP